MWPFRGREKRASYTDAITQALIQQAQGSSRIITAAAVAAVETAAGTVGRAMAAANVEGLPAGLITKAMLADIGRRLIRNGDVVFEIRVSAAGELQLVSAFTSEVTGGADPMSWRYRLDIPGPSLTPTRVRPYSSVLHFTYATDPSRPWIGVSPLAWASATGRLAGAIEQALGDEHSGPHGHLLPVPGDMSDADEDALKGDLRNMKGRALLVETTQAGFGQGRAEAPQRDWVPRRLGANVPDSTVMLQGVVHEQVLAACGVPSELGLKGGEASAQREAWRRFLHGTVQPMADMIAEELTMKLERPVMLTFDQFFASDVTGRARAYASLVGAEMPADRAAQLTGMDVNAGS